MRIPLVIPSAAAPWDVITIGENSVDFVALVGTFPTPNSKQQVQRLTRLPGGQMATAAAACATLGWRTRYLGTFGDDDLGAFGRDSLQRAGVDISIARIVPQAASRTAIVIVDRATTSRTVLWDRDQRLAIDVTSLPPDTFSASRLLIVDATDLDASVPAARLARAAGVVTIADVDAPAPQLGDFLADVDVIVAAESLPSALTGRAETGAALEALARESGAPLVVVTLGEEGSLARCADREIRTPGFGVDCVDSTGAGDAFRAGLAAGLLTATEVEDVLVYANAVAALNCRGLGARGALPTRDEVDALRATRQNR